MKRTNLILLFLMALAWTGCHKDKEMKAKDPVVTNVEMTVSETQARFSWQVDFAGEFHTGVEVSQNEDMNDLRRVEGSLEGDKFVAVVDDLSAGTNLYYRFVVWNKFNSFEQEVKSFSTSPYTITTTCVPAGSGTITGEGFYVTGDTCVLMALANAGYTFLNWTENGNQVSTNANYRFTVTGDRTLVANFSFNGGGNVPTGAINGLFTINANGDQVFFSQGNLQYHTGDSVWRFAEHQYDTIGRKNNGNSYSGNWMFLFGWGTGDNPMNASENNDDYSTFVDWGINAISNGGNQTGIWRTLSSEEWLYLFNGRLNANDKYGTGNVNGIGGLIILPDNWICPTGLTFNPGFSMDDTDWSHNTYTFAQWQQMEDAGAVLLPSILGGWVLDVGFGGGGYHRLVNVYWSFAGINENATYLFFNGMDLSPQNYDFNEHRNYRLAVRLVHNAD